MTFKKPIAGEPANLILSESFQSALVDVVNAHQRGELTRKETEFRKDHVVTVKNESGADVKSGELLAIEQDVTPPAYSDTVQSFVQNPLVIGNAVTWHSNIGYVAVATQPILQDMLGPCSFRPFGQVQADIGGAGDWLMVNPTNPQQFKRSTGGIARVIAFDATTGKCVADFLEQQPLWRFVLLDDVQNLLGPANLLDLGGNVYATVTVRFTNSTKVAGEGGFCLHTGNHFDAIEAAATVGQGPTPRFRFRLKTDFDDTGQADAYVLDVFGSVTLPDGSPVQLGDILTVHDPRKCFAHAIGADTLTGIQGVDPLFPAGGSIGYAVKTNQLKADPSDPDNDQYPRWEVEQCTQVINKMRVEISRGDTSDVPTGEIDPDEPPKTMKVIPNEAVVSQWPYVDYPPELVPPEGERTFWSIEVTNPHRFSAGDGWAVIERVQKGCRPEDASNVDTPYTAKTLYDAEWQIVEVQNPIARWLCAKREGDNWIVEEVLRTFEGEDPITVNYFQNSSALNQRINTHPCLDIDCIEDDEIGVAFWDPNAQFYYVISTNSALYGSAKQLEVIGRTPPAGGGTPLLRFGDASAGEEPCDLKYKKTTPVRVFGANTACPEAETDETAQSNLQAVDVVANVVRTGDELCFTYDTVYVCRSDSGVSDDCINVCCPEPTGCCEYPPGTYTPGVTQSACDAQGGTWTLGDCPSDCLVECSECTNGGASFALDGLSWSGQQTGSGQSGHADISTATWTAYSDCCATLSVTLKSDDPTVSDVQATAQVCIVQPSQCQNAMLELELVWSPATFDGVTLPTNLGAGIVTGCSGTYGLQGGCVVPDQPDPNTPSGGWDEVDITVTDCSIT